LFSRYAADPFEKDGYTAADGGHGVNGRRASCDRRTSRMSLSNVFAGVCRALQLAAFALALSAAYIWRQSHHSARN
jgi:hypothetical protein